MDQFLDIVRKYLENYPKTRKQLLEWQKNALLQFQKAATQADSNEKELVIPPIDDNLAEQMLCTTFLLNHRSLYDFFDGVECKIFVNWEEKGYTGTVNEEKIEEYFKTRTEAEQGLFKKAIDKLENQ